MNLRTRLTRLVIPVFAVGSIAAVGIQSVGAAKIDDKRAQAKAVEAQLAETEAKSSALGEQLNAANLELASAQHAVEEAQNKIATAQTEADRLKGQLNDRAAAIYKSAGGTNAFEQLNVDNASDFETRSKYSSAAASEDDELIDQLKRAQEELAVQKAESQRTADAADARRADLASAKDEIAALEGERQATLDGLNGEIKTLVNQEQAARQRSEDNAPPQRGASNRPGVGDIPTNLPPASGGAAAAIAYALAQVGKPYQYAATGPDSFDCSGLTMMAWAQGGVSMPHFSGAQYAMFPRVPLDQLQPGDLLFPSDPGAHVSLYLGNGQKVAATHTGDYVRVQSVGDTALAVRPG
jgi:cell wall-associated NlpC family hydrolase